MSSKTKEFIINVGAMLFANGVSFLISSIIAFIIPKFLSVENYAYVQLYIFYTSYISYLHYGWVDGIRLRYGGIYYDNINKPLFKTQILIYSIIQCTISLLVISLVLISNIDGNRLIALACVGFCMLIRLPRLMPQYILEMSNRIKQCANITLIERVTYLILTLLIIFSGKISVLLLLSCDLIGQLLSVIYAFWCCKDILISKVSPIKEAITEIKKNIESGIKLTIANVSSLLIIGIVRFFIEKEWNVSTFGKISLTISISNLLMVFIRAVAMVMFPTLRRVDQKNLKSIYSKLRIGIMVPLLGLLVIYYPTRYLVSLWLPQYADSLVYMAMLFPMCIFESKMSMLIETYLKTLRLEGLLLKINIITVFLSVITTIITTCVIHNLSLAVISIVCLLAFRCILSEVLLSKRLKIYVKKHIILEMILVTVFIASSWIIGGILGLLIYITVYIIYILIVKKDIVKLLMSLKKTSRNIKKETLKQ